MGVSAQTYMGKFVAGMPPQKENKAHRLILKVWEFKIVYSLTYFG